MGQAETVPLAASGADIDMTDLPDNMTNEQLADMLVDQGIARMRSNPVEARQDFEHAFQYVHNECFADNNGSFILANANEKAVASSSVTYDRESLDPDARSKVDSNTAGRPLQFVLCQDQLPRKSRVPTDYIGHSGSKSTHYPPLKCIQGNNSHIKPPRYRPEFSLHKQLHEPASCFLGVDDFLVVPTVLLRIPTRILCAEFHAPETKKAPVCITHSTPV